MRWREQPHLSPSRSAIYSNGRAGVPWVRIREVLVAGPGVVGGKVEMRPSLGGVKGGEIT